MSIPVRTSSTFKDQTLVVAYDQELDEDNPPLPSDWDITLNGVSLVPNSAVVLNQNGIGVAYVGTNLRGWPGIIGLGFAAGRLRNKAGELAVAFIGDQIVNSTTATDTSVPVLLAARVDSGQSFLYFNEVLDPAFLPVPSKFVVNRNGVSDVVVNGGVSIYGTRVTLVLIDAFDADDAGGLAYDNTGIGGMRDFGGNLVASIPFPVQLTNVTDAAGYYGSQAGIEDIYGENNVAQWSNLNNDVTGPDEQKIVRALAKTDRWINRALKVGGYVTPIDSSSTDFALLTDIADEMAGVMLYEARGMIDAGGGDFAATVAGKMEAHRKHAEQMLADLISGGVDGVFIAGADEVGGGIQVIQPSDTLCGALYPYPNYLRL